MNRPVRPKLRCAIYTRKSSEEGLDQEFNSLRAQREACEAYVTSQAGEGWTIRAKVYDDGGFSGGSMDRPGLRALLADIEARLVDVVVVYKVDRLTRSLTDFARIIERFDARQVSFVSVTQAFNTTTSMGRLTLNVLLSFAQFEREVTGERIRDKIAASKKKGMWMGGRAPLGYQRPVDSRARTLVVNEAEAQTVRRIFGRYLELGSVHLLRDELAEEGICTKAYVTSDGRQIGGGPWGRGALYHLLKNRTYIGEIPHKGQSYPGQHPAIVERPVFDAVQRHLAEAVVRNDRSRPSAEAPLKGVVFGADGRPMTPTSSKGRGGRAYRYYTALALQQGLRLIGEDAIARVSATALECLVLETAQRIGRLGCDAGWDRARPLLSRIDVFPQRLSLALKAGALLDLYADHGAELERLQRRLSAGEKLHFTGEGDAHLTLTLPVRMKVIGGRSWITRPDGRPLAKPVLDRTFIRGLKKAHRTLRDLGAHPDASPEERRRSRSPQDPYRHGLCAIALLAPDIQAAILEGRQPPGLNLERLIHSEIPIFWAEQRRVLGFE